MPATNSTGRADGRSLSMPGLLAFLCGSGAFFGYWRFYGLTANWSRLDRLLFVGGTSLFALWGLWKMIDAWWPSRRRRSGHHVSSVRGDVPNGSSLVRSISWVGILLLVAGIELLLTFRWYVPPGWPATVVVVLGVLSIVEGIRRIIMSFRPRRRGTRLRYHVALTRPGAVYLLVMTVLLIGSLVGRSNMLMLVFALMVGAFVLNGWITFSMLRRTDVTRHAAERIVAGEPFTVGVTLRNRKLLFASSVMTVCDQIESEHERLEARVLFRRVPARSSKAGHYRIRLMQRGVYHFGPIRLFTRFPLGLVERELTFDSRNEVLVYPRIGRLTEAWRRDRSHATEILDRATSTRGMFQDEFQGMREYRPGDSPRAIHWRTSARQGELMVREFHETRGQDLMLLLDLWMPDDPRPEDRERVELAVSFAATLAVEQTRRTQNSRLDVVVSGRAGNHWALRTGPTGIDALLEGLALVEAGTARDVAELTAPLRSRRTSSMRVLLLTTRPSREEFFRVLDDSSSESTGPSMGDVQVLPVNQQQLAPFFVLE